MQQCRLQARYFHDNSLAYKLIYYSPQIYMNIHKIFFLIILLLTPWKASYGSDALRPLVIFRSEKINTLEQIIQDPKWEKLVQKMRQRVLKSKINSVPRHIPSKGWQQKDIADRLRTEIAIAGLAYHFFKDDRHLKSTKENLLRIAGWENWGEKDLAVAGFLTISAWGYDWFYKEFSQSEREKLKQAIIQKGVKRVLDYNSSSHSHSPFIKGASPNHMASNAAALGFAALVLPEESNAKTWLNLAIQKMRESLMTAGGDDGGPVEGFNYGVVHIFFAKNFLSELKAIKDVDLIHEFAWLENFPFYAAYTMGPSGVLVNFNDSHLKPRGLEKSALLWIYSQFPKTAGGRVAYYQLQKMKNQNITPLGLLDLSKPILDRKGVHLPLVKTFPSVGQVFVRTSWDDDALLFASRSQKLGPNGVMAHTHYDAGHFVMNWGRDTLLTDPGYAVQGFLKSHDPKKFKFDMKDFKYLNVFTLRSPGHNTLHFDQKGIQWGFTNNPIRASNPEENVPAFFVEMEFGDTYLETRKSKKKRFDSVRRRIIGFLPFGFMVHDHVRSTAGPTQMSAHFHSRMGKGHTADVQINNDEVRVSDSTWNHAFRIQSISPKSVSFKELDFPPRYHKTLTKYLSLIAPSAENHDVYYLVLPEKSDFRVTVLPTVNPHNISVRLSNGKDWVELELSRIEEERVGQITWQVGTKTGTFEIRP